ncbi:succinic semialdehyde dehydrogenase [Antrihabitans stalactiti]|uniref:Succinate-semialdehyde dehydrogenase (NADP(+)) n=1 Tax=Antrihabitans stalactiti TaxID=2584121 RepID=A0A848KIV2_9NOCA|nr:succinic semialdehyde dehydrogenase [Antrihabitans stalactiti]NMN99003.1 succinate-semialdehyde dehydrogenase (NADP(+)) [Antrihabitans stalactiti]
MTTHELATPATPRAAFDRSADLPPSLTPDVVNRLAGLVSAKPDAPRVTTRAPYTLETLAALPVSTPDDVADAFVTAHQAQREWAKTSFKARRRIMLRFHDLVLKRQDEVLDLMQAESGKTRRDAFMEVTDIAVTSRYYARTAHSLLAPKRRRGVIPGMTSTTELRHPKGVVAVISPWNYPLSMAASDTIAALMAGNAVVQKPDTQTALTALWALALMREAGLPDHVWQIVIGRGSSIGTSLMNNANYMMFTGSTASGRQIASAAGERLIGASLELGGKNAMVVLDDADIDRAVEGAIAASFPSAGQLCVSIERMYVHEDIYDDFVPRFVERTRRMRLGASYDFDKDMGSLTNSSQLDTVLAHVDDAVSKGATVLAGGRPRPDLGPLFYEPTILEDVTPDMTLYRSETFGPVVSIYPFSSDETAVRLANDTVYGLNASVWTRNSARGQKIAAQIHAGTVNVNEAFVAAWGSVDSPMGGMGDSGVGRRHGAEGILKYTEAQTVAYQRLHNLNPPPSISWRLFAKATTQALKVAKITGMR